MGRTDYCSYPEEAEEVPSIGTYTSPNTELIISMTPDVIFASDYIDDSIRSQVEGAGAKVIVFAASDLEGVEQNILTAGQVLNLNGEAKEITDGMEAEMAQLQEILSANTEEKSRVYRSGRILQRRRRLSSGQYAGGYRRPECGGGHRGNVAAAFRGKDQSRAIRTSIFPCTPRRRS